MKVVVDTNVLVSAAMRDRNPEKAIQAIVNQADVTWFATQAILDEYYEVLLRPKIDLLDVDREEWLDLLQKSVTLIDAPAEPEFPRDPKDARFLACALASDADFLITGDKDFREAQKILTTTIISVSMFLRLIG